MPNPSELWEKKSMNLSMKKKRETLRNVQPWYDTEAMKYNVIQTK
jgi:hypothetical protein